ncbi:hypothetical protein BMS3Bbin09_00168 [bacterium BMS3Bbin09]|nr:hypothetical protein BMS3Bbin09_00168 [bacterium BMS3Bbin09]
MKTKNLSLFLILILVFISLFIFLISCGGNKDSTTTAPPPGSWGTAGLIEGGTGNAYVPHVSMDASGNAIAVWYQDDGININIYANRYVAGAGWGTAGLIEGGAGNAFVPRVSMDGSGSNAIAVWYQHDGTRYNIWANRYVAGAGWGTAELIETDDIRDARNPQISVDGSGNAVAVWFQNDGTRWNIWANRYVAGVGWGTAGLIETDDTGSANSPQVSVAADGNAIAVWYQDDGTRDNIRANRYVAGIGWGTAELIETDNTGDARNPQISVDGSGNAIAVWYQNDGTRWNILANRFNRILL